MKRTVAILSFSLMLSLAAFSQMPNQFKARLAAACADCCQGDCDGCCKGHCINCNCGRCDHCLHNK